MKKIAFSIKTDIFSLLHLTLHGTTELELTWSPSDSSKIAVVIQRRKNKTSSPPYDDPPHDALNIMYYAVDFV